MAIGKLFSSRNILFYFISIWIKRVLRMIRWQFDKKPYSSDKSYENLSYRIKKHQSVLIRKYPDTDISLQYNKVTNLKIAIEKIDGIIIKPGETFSFYKLVGHPSKRKGYLPGMELSYGKVRPGIGGGLCQIVNLIHWLVIHSALTVTERHHHSFDPFPDSGRILPFGSGASVFYNYYDYQFTNFTPYTYQIRLWLSEKCLEGDLRNNFEMNHVYHVFEKNHKFIKKGNTFFRENEIWRVKYQKCRNSPLEYELISKNSASVMYIPDKFIEEAENVYNSKK